MTTMTMVHFACDVCEGIRDFAKKTLSKIWITSVKLGYARAAGELRRHKLFKEAEDLSRYLKELN